MGVFVKLSSVNKRDTDASVHSAWAESLRLEVHMDATATMEVQLALYVFQEAVSPPVQHPFSVPAT